MMTCRAPCMMEAVAAFDTGCTLRIEAEVKRSGTACTANSGWAAFLRRDEQDAAFLADVDVEGEVDD